MRYFITLFCLLLFSAGGASALEQNLIKLISPQDEVQWVKADKNCIETKETKHTLHLLSAPDFTKLEPFADILEATHQTTEGCPSDTVDNLDHISHMIILERKHQYASKTVSLWKKETTDSSFQIERGFGILSYTICCNGGSEGTLIDLETGDNILTFSNSDIHNFEYKFPLIGGGPSIIAFSNQAEAEYPQVIKDHAIGYLISIKKRLNETPLKLVYAFLDKANKKATPLDRIELNELPPDSRDRFRFQGKRSDAKNAPSFEAIIPFFSEDPFPMSHVVIENRVVLPPDISLCGFRGGTVSKPIWEDLSKREGCEAALMK